jgi:tungstate transport system ATP-binding protein
MIRARDLRVRFGATTALALDLLEVADGERVGVVGRNGSGKTTLLRVLAGLQRPTAGTIEGVPPPGRTVLLHQRPHLFLGTARSNVAYALARAGRPRSEADGWLARVGASALAGRDAAGLSAGERARVAIARALARGPDLLLLDEPFATLDDEGLRTVPAAIAEFRGTLLVASPSADGLPVARVVELAGSRP